MAPARVRERAGARLPVAAPWSGHLMQSSIAGVRRPAVAGTFYPGEPEVLERTVREALGRARRPAGHPKAMIVPHAGYVYSGPVASTAYAVLADREPPIERVVLLGPSHRVRVSGLAAPSAVSFRSPLGDIPIDHEALARVRDLPQVRILDEAHALEHSLEVQLPFLQVLLGSFSLVPFSVGDASPEEVDEVLERLWGGPESLVVVSSDLSHYLDYDRARAMDAETTLAIEALDLDALHEDSACGRVPIRGLLRLAQRHGLTCQAVDLRSSGDTAGGRGRVVGYGSYFFFEGDAPAGGPGTPTLSATGTRSVRDRLDLALRDHEIIDVARRAVEQAARLGKPLIVDVARFSPPLRASRAAFVTVERAGELRGCIGDLEAFRPLVVSVADNAFNAACRDPRMQPVAEAELPDLDIHVSILSPHQRLQVASEDDLLARLRPGIDGLVLREGPRRATFLPSAWKSIREPIEFVRQLKRKAGLSPDHWSDTLEIFRYEAELIG